MFVGNLLQALYAEIVPQTVADSLVLLGRAAWRSPSWASPSAPRLRG